MTLIDADQTAQSHPLSLSALSAPSARSAFTRIDSSLKSRLSAYPSQTSCMGTGFIDDSRKTGDARRKRQCREQTRISRMTRIDADKAAQSHPLPLSALSVPSARSAFTRIDSSLKSRLSAYPPQTSCMGTDFIDDSRKTGDARRNCSAENKRRLTRIKPHSRILCLYPRYPCHPPDPRSVALIHP